MNKIATTYQRLGDYIRLADKRNTDLKVETLLGLSIEKRFISSIANTIGTDMSTYKIMQPGQFAYGPVTSRNGDKITIALYDGELPIIISQSYVTFEIFKSEELDAEYLMMWFRRPEFDRYARFKSHGSAREIFDWETMCDVELPIPSISEQRAIVVQYKALTKRIETNNQLIAKLEETAQALYRKMFVDDIDKENLPDGWRMGTLGEVAEIKAGGDAPQIVKKAKTKNCPYPIYANGFENDGLYGYTNRAIILEPCITLSARGTIGFCCIRKESFVPIVRLIIVIPFNKSLVNYFGMFFKRNRIEGDGSVQGQLTIPYVSKISIVLPMGNVMEAFNESYSKIEKHIYLLKEEINKLKELQSLLLTKMGR